MIPPPKKVWSRFTSKVISKLGRFPRPLEAITRTTRHFLGRLGTVDPGGRRCCRCSCHYQPEYWVQAVHRSLWNENNMEVEFEDDQRVENGDQSLEFLEDLTEDHAVDERAEEFIAKFHESLKLERLQHF